MTSSSATDAHPQNTQTDFVERARRLSDDLRGMVNRHGTLSTMLRVHEETPPFPFSNPFSKLNPAACELLKSQLAGCEERIRRLLDNHA